MSNDNALDPRGIAEEVAKELEEQVQEPLTEEAKAEPKEEPKPEEAEAEPEAPESHAEPKEEKRETPERKSKYVPVTKANAWRHEANEYKAKALELERQLQELKDKPNAEDLDALAKEVAGEEASPEVVKRILSAAKKLAPKAADPELAALKGQLREQLEQQGFERELKTTLAKFPELSGYESDLKEVAYAEGNERIPLELLALKVREDLNLSQRPPSSEGKQRQAKTEPEPDFENMTEDDIAKLSPEDTDRLIEWQRQKRRR